MSERGEDQAPPKRPLPPDNVVAWTPRLVDPPSLAKRRVRRLTSAILAAGFAVSIAVYIAAGAETPNPLGYDPLQNKQYLHQMEVYGGKANVLAEEFREWFASLWHERSLAFTLAVITILLALTVRFFAMPLPPETMGEPESGGDHVA